MGGSLAVTIVDPEGTWHKMDRWTNPTPWYFTDTRFLNGDPALLKEFLDTWYEMVKEYDDYANGVIGAPEPRMSKTYCNREYSSRDLVAPSEYGLVFLDIPGKRFWHMQGYSSYDRLSITRLLMDEQDWSTLRPEELKAEMAHYESMLPRIKIHTTPIGRGKSNDVPVSFSTVDELVAHAFSIEADHRSRRTSNWSSYELDMSGWDYRRFGDDRAGAAQFKAALTETGYEFSEKENHHWSVFRNYEDED